MWITIKQWCDQGQNLKAKTKDSTIKAKAWTVDAKAAFKHMAEIKICCTSDRIGDKLKFDCFGFYYLFISNYMQIINLLL